MIDLNSTVDEAIAAARPAARRWRQARVVWGDRVVTVRLFGRLVDVAGWRERVLDPGPARLSEARAMLGALDPRLGEALAAPGVRAAVDRVLASGDTALTAGAEVAFMPPMSGG